MKEVYQAPEIVLVEFNPSDIIAASTDPPITEDDDGKWSRWYD